MTPGRLKTCHITTADSSLARLLKTRLSLIRKAGFTVETMSAPGDYVKELTSSGFKHIEINNFTRKWSPFSDLKAFWEIYKKLKKNQYDIVNTYSPKAGIFGRIAAYFAGVQIIAHTSWGLYFSEDSSWARKLFFIGIEKICAVFCDHIWSVNRDDLNLMLKYKIKSPDQLSYLGNAADLTYFQPVNKSRKDMIREKYFLAKDDIVVTIVGRIVREKGYFEFIDAAKNLKPYWKNVKFISVGPSDYSKPDALPEAFIKQIESENIVRFLGMQDYMPDIYALSDIIVLPSYREGFPRSLVEAGASGLPIVTTDTRGCREAVDHGINGFLVPLKDSMALKLAIEKLLKNPELRKKFGSSGRKRAVSKFNEKDLVNQITNTYRKLTTRLNNRNKFKSKDGLREKAV